MSLTAMPSKSQKRESRWGYSSLFGSKGTSKVIIPGSTTQTTTEHQPVEHTGADSSKLGPTARFRRSSSKVLSILGLRSNRGSRAGYSSSTPASERDLALAIVRDATATAAADESHANTPKGLTPLKIPTSQRVVTPITMDAPPFQIPFAATPKSLHPQIGETKFSEAQTQYRIISMDIPVRRKEGGDLRHSRSVPGLAHQLSHKISSTFGNPTIVHRPSMKSRPSLQSMRDTPIATVVISAARDVIPYAATDPSTQSEGTSPVSLSTAKTSLESNLASALAKPKELLDKASSGPPKIVPQAAEKDLPEKPLTPIQEFPYPAAVKPTIKTVETTANAKIFFETHFNSILSGQATPRSLRRYELELKLLSGNFTPEDRHCERHLWADQESEYLRQSRVRKSQSHKITGSKGVSIAGYEVVRILGKGSFGVVRLVREKGSVEDEPSTIRKTRKSASSDEWRRKQNVYAMKVIRKSDMLRNSQEGHLRAERDFLVASEKSRWVVPLIASFQDTTNLYLVMEYMIGGDFLGLLIRYGQLKEKRTKWYLAEMVLCVEEAHRLRWIHRDVKPDNFLITSSGHLKISDFGLAFDGHWAHDQSYFNNHRYSLLEKLGIKIEGDSIDRADFSKTAAGKKLANILMGGRELRVANNRHEVPSNEERDENEGLLQWRNRYGKRKLARSVVGTSQYMAPEVIRGELYDGRCDWWSIGIIMFECLYGWTPFVGEDRQDTKARILNHQKEFRFPPTAFTEKKYKVSHDAKDLVNRLLQEKEHRLCSKKYLINDFEEERAPLRATAHGNQSQQPQDFQGYFVFPDDATDIKAHPFFQGIPWERLHLTKPPEVPDVKSRYDTKYFDEDEPISDVDDASSTSSLQEEVLKAQEEYEEEIAKAYETANAKELSQGQDTGTQIINNAAFPGKVARTDVVATGRGEIVLVGPNKAAKLKEKKRPRDRILRDTKVAKQVLEIRKKGAFIGYTYQRPKPVLTSIENGRVVGESLSKRPRIASIL